jgi:hypothetical protein
MVHHRHIQWHDLQFLRHGSGKHRLGQRVGVYVNGISISE